jgi:hypothetical protein
MGGRDSGGALRCRCVERKGTAVMSQGRDWGGLRVGGRGGVPLGSLALELQRGRATETWQLSWRE